MARWFTHSLTPSPSPIFPLRRRERGTTEANLAGCRSAASAKLTRRSAVIGLPNDILGVIQHFAPQGQPPYDVRFDRGPQTGANVWNMGPPDGVIDLPNDILGIILQFQHNCV